MGRGGCNIGRTRGTWTIQIGESISEDTLRPRSVEDVGRETIRRTWDNVFYSPMRLLSFFFFFPKEEKADGKRGNSKWLVLTRFSRWALIQMDRNHGVVNGARGT